MSMSQISETALSDLLPDVDNFIEETQIKNMVHLIEIEHTHHQFQQPLHILEQEHEDYNLPDEDYKIFNVENFIPVPPFPPAFPPDEPSTLTNEEYPGPYRFDVYIIPDGQKTPWEYSSKLNKIFILMGVKFPVAFSVGHRPNGINLFVRATPVFSQSQYFQELVFRCIGHQHAQDPSNKDCAPHVFQHIIRCSNDNTRYFGDKDTRKRLSLVLPLGVPQPGTDTVKEFFQFVCKNSCPNPLNRRTTEVIFTLESESGEVVGRRVVAVRICSCPKRDKEKEEKELNKTSGAAPHGKKRKLDNVSEGKKVPVANDSRQYRVDFTIMGKKNYQRILEYAQLSMMAEVAVCNEKGISDVQIRKNLKDVNTLLHKCQDRGQD